MMDYTENLHLRKPAAGDFYDIGAFNSNTDVVDALFPDGILPIEKGGTGAADAAAALTALGAFPAHKVVEDVASPDCNDYTDDGWHYFSSSHTPAHAPEGAQSGWLHTVQGPNADYIFQEWYVLRQNDAYNYWKKYTRQKQGPTTGWRDWVCAMTEKDIPALATRATVADSATTATSAAKATKLATARTIRTNLAGTTAASFDGTANVTPGVMGTLPIANGGTGATKASAALTNLGAAAAEHSHTSENITETIKPIAIGTFCSNLVGGGSTLTGYARKIGKRICARIRVTPMSSGKNASVQMVRIASTYYPNDTFSTAGVGPVSGYGVIGSRKYPVTGYINAADARNGIVTVVFPEVNLNFDYVEVWADYYCG